MRIYTYTSTGIYVYMCANKCAHVHSCTYIHMLHTYTYVCVLWVYGAAGGWAGGCGWVEVGVECTCLCVYACVCVCASAGAVPGACSVRYLVRLFCCYDCLPTVFACLFIVLDVLTCALAVRSPGQFWKVQFRDGSWDIHGNGWRGKLALTKPIPLT